MLDVKWRLVRVFSNFLLRIVKTCVTADGLTCVIDNKNLWLMREALSQGYMFGVLYYIHIGLR